MNKSGLGAKIDVEIKKHTPIIKSVWDVICTDKFGVEKWKKHQENIVTDQGLAALLDIMFLDATKISSWYVALLEAGSSADSASTYAVPKYTECTTYTEGIRPTYVGVRSSLEITNNASKAVFTMNSAKSLIGGSLVGGGTDGSTVGNKLGGGTLYCSIDFDEPGSAVETDIISIAITLVAADIPPAP